MGTKLYLKAEKALKTSLWAASCSVCCSLWRALSLGGIYNQGWLCRQGGRSSLLTKNVCAFSIISSRCALWNNRVKGQISASMSTSSPVSWHSLGPRLPSCPPGDSVHLCWTSVVGLVLLVWLQEQPFALRLTSNMLHSVNSFANPSKYWEKEWKRGKGSRLLETQKTFHSGRGGLRLALVARREFPGRVCFLTSFK